MYLKSLNNLHNKNGQRVQNTNPYLQVSITGLFYPFRRTFIFVFGRLNLTNKLILSLPDHSGKAFVLLIMLFFDTHTVISQPADRRPVVVLG